MSPISTYLDELARLLRRRGRRRVLAEVRTHLLDSAEAAVQAGASAADAQRHAVARFGTPQEVARTFAAVSVSGAGRTRGRALRRRVVAVLLAATATASLGTATVWALEPSAGHHAHPHAQHHRVHRHVP